MSTTITRLHPWARLVYEFKQQVQRSDCTWHTLGVYTDRRPAADRLFALRVAHAGDGLAFRARRSDGGTRIEIQVRWGEGITSATAFGDQGAVSRPSPRGDTQGSE